MKNSESSVGDPIRIDQAQVSKDYLGNQEFLGKHTHSDAGVLPIEYLKRAYRNALNSPDPSTQNGSVVVVPIEVGKVVVVDAWNDFPNGIQVTPERIADRDTKIMMIEHAERNAIYKLRSRKPPTAKPLGCRV